MRWFLLLPFSVLMTVLAYLLAPVLPFFSRNGWLPRWLWWFQTPDMVLDGDAAFKAKNAPFPGDVSGWRRHINQTVWLWRNPSYGFDWSVLAYTPSPENKLTVIGQRIMNGALVIDSPDLINGDVGHNGWYFARLGSAWQLYITLHYTKKHSTKFNFGWKLWDGKGPYKYTFSFLGGIWKSTAL